MPLVTELAKKFGAEIHILYVMKDYPAFGASYGRFDPDDLKKMQEWEKQTAGSRLTEICDKFLNECPLYIRHIGVGEPAKEIPAESSPIPEDRTTTGRFPTLQVGFQHFSSSGGTG